jgi:hypothetical protein
MDLENVKVMIDTPEQTFAEYEFTAQSSETGRTIHLLFFGCLVAENGKVKRLRESVRTRSAPADRAGELGQVLGSEEEDPEGEGDPDVLWSDHGLVPRGDGASCARATACS